MNAKKFSEAMSELDTKYVDEAISYKKKTQKLIWVKWGVVAACLALVCVAAISLFPHNNDSVTTPGIADAAQMTQVIIWTAYPKKTSRQITLLLAQKFINMAITL